ncbi:DUF993 family protein [Streptomyces yaizuensis]|uniref:Dihydrodipicolinate synthase family protein n=1 Tax=Streptomyces yaizuensis TaxID=2989713 RepID=A0ABQ5NTB5_9ACTN|nr:DUF993 family protein [Streptomyces sp. YSPA8]GLF93614.1 dihydrodipicolinate synthase family protein [Streptomyces sp. YSPA8]
MTIRLPGADGTLRDHTPCAEPLLPAPGPAPSSRTLFAAVHVVADPLAEPGDPRDPAARAVLDWDATLAVRHRLWAHGLAVAEAMDTAQRGTGLDWGTAAELIRRSAAEARAVGGALVCGVGTDQLPERPVNRGTGALAAVRRAYAAQLELAEAAGARPVLMASRALAAAARGPDDYLDVYGGLLRQSAGPVVLHWLGPMFDPALDGYWGSADLDRATATLLDLVAAHPGRVDGVKVSLLDAERERDLRRRLPAGVRCYTGDDFHYPELIAGDEHGFSHALLGILDPLGPLVADAARAALDRGDPAGFRARLEPTVPLARHLFGPPTRHYKTGLVLLAWLAGHQRHFAMVGGLHSARSLPHLARAYELADGLGLFPDPALAESRMRTLLTLYGVGA